MGAAFILRGPCDLRAGLVGHLSTLYYFYSQGSKILKSISSLRFMSAISSRSSQRLLLLDQGGTVFSHYTALANKHKAVNLGQGLSSIHCNILDEHLTVGFPTLDIAPFLQQAALNSVANKCLLHQYTRSEGHPRLVQALASFYSPQLGREIDGLKEVMVTVGASEAIYSTIQALVDPGDEVILMQVCFHFQILT
jgi:DNA-binding transcriptional MocR family regulator